MTPGARIGAAIEVLDRIAEGVPAEQALTNWARGARFAGSKDRAAIRDHVFDALRRWRSSAAIGGAATGRGRIIGLCRSQGIDPATLFTGEGHAPDRLGEAEKTVSIPGSAQIELDCPDWLWEAFGDSLGPARKTVLATLQNRAPVFLRVNLARTDLPGAQDRLEQDSIATRPVAGVRTALEVTENARKVAQSQAFAEGLIEVQDASSQAACLMLDSEQGERVLDYCAGGGGKALALAALGASVTAHDIEPRRMGDIAPRSLRAGVSIAEAATATLGRLAPFDTVFCDAPCSGSGTWRRSPEAKWRLTPDRLVELCKMQDEVLWSAADLVRPGGRLGYATCSVLTDENSARIKEFLKRRPGWTLISQKDWLPGASGDGFHLSVVRRDA